MEGVGRNWCQSSIFYLASSPTCGRGLLVILKSRFFALETLTCVRLFPIKVTFVSSYVCNRVESGSDDPDNVGHLGHFFDGSSGSHPQTKLSGCDPDFLVH